MTVLLSAQNLTKSFGHRPLFVNLAFDLRAGERIGLIGPNGAGKSTLLKMLAELEPADEGEVSKRRSSRIGYVSQDDVFEQGKSVRDVMLDSLAEEPIEDYERETRTTITLTQVGFEDHDQPASQLSGGWRKRLSLARQFVLEPDLLLLDEPTNHLDLPGIVWLEQLLRGANFSYLVATHDRAFLRAVTDEIIEINRAYPDGFFRTSGSYEEFIAKRVTFLEGQARQQEAIANQVRRDTEWLGRQAAARTSKSGSRIEDAAQRREELAELKYRNSQAGNANIDFVASGRKTRKLLNAEGISKSLGGRTLFSDLELMLTPGMKLGLLGPNGSGKSTLLHVLADLTPSDAGEIARAEGLKTIMFEQGRAALDPEVTLKKALCPIGDTIKYRDGNLHVAAWAKRFLFRTEQLELTVGNLSGGEQARVRIAQLMTQPADLLLLDEPTNDLDIPALEVLEESLAEFPGALVVVSHDRDLLDRLCSEVIGLDGHGGASTYASVSQWLRAYEKAEAEREKAAKVEKESKSAPVKRERTKPKAKKLSYREKQELEGMEDAIAEAEESVEQCQAKVEASATDHVALTEACQALEDAQAKVEQLYARWEELEAIRDASA